MTQQMQTPLTILRKALAENGPKEITEMISLKPGGSLDTP